MIEIRNVSGRPRGVTPANEPEFVVDADETAEVSDELGKSLLEQPRNWQLVVETTTEDKE